MFGMNPSAPSFVPRNTQASSVAPLIDSSEVRPAGQNPIILEGDEERRGRSLLSTSFNYSISENGTTSTRSLGSSLGNFLAGFLNEFGKLLERSPLILTGDAASLIRNNDQSSPPQNIVINFHIKDSSPDNIEPLRAALTLWLDYRGINLPASEFHHLRDNLNTQYLQVTLSTIPTPITLQFSVSDFIASPQNTPQIDLLPLLEPTPSPSQSAAAAAEESNGSSSIGDNICDDIYDDYDDINEFVEDFHALKTVDQLLEEILDPGSSPVAYALLAIRLFEKSGKLKDSVADPLIQKVRELIPDLISEKQEWLAFDLWIHALKKIAFQKLENLKNPKEAPCTGALLKALLQDAPNENLDKHFDATLTLYNQLLSLKPPLDRVLLGKLLKILAPHFQHFFLNLSNEQRKDKIERVISLFQLTFERVDLPVQIEMSTLFAAACATPELFQIATECIGQIYQAQKEKPKGLINPGLKHLINQFILATLSRPESDSYHCWEDLLRRFSTVKEGEQALFDASFIQKMTPRLYLQSENAFLTYPLKRFLSFFKTFTLLVSPQPVSASASASSSSSSSSSACSVEGAIEGALVKGLEYINKASIALQEKRELISGLFTGPLLSRFPALKVLCEESTKKPVEKDLLNGLGKLFPELTEELNTLQINTESYYPKLQNILFRFLEEYPSEKQISHLNKMHPLFNAEEKKQRASRPAASAQWRQDFSQLISLHISLLSKAPISRDSTYFKEALSLLKSAIQENLILMEDFKTVFTLLYQATLYQPLIAKKVVRASHPEAQAETAWLPSSQLEAGVPQKDAQKRLLAICTESNLDTRQFFYSKLIAIHVRIVHAFESNQLEQLNALATELSQFHKKQSVYSRELKEEAFLFYHKLEEGFPSLQEEPAARELCATLNRLTQSSSGSSSSTSAALKGLSKETRQEFGSSLNENSLITLDSYKNESAKHLNDHQFLLKYAIIGIAATKALFLRPERIKNSETAKIYVTFLMHACSLLEEAHERFQTQLTEAMHTPESLNKKNKELEKIAENISDIYTQIGAAYYAENTSHQYFNGLTILDFLLNKYPKSNELHRYLEPYFHCICTHPQKKPLKIQKSSTTLLQLAKAHLERGNYEEYVAHVERAWGDPHFVRTKEVTDHLGVEHMTIKQWDKALSYFTFLKKIEDVPQSLSLINGTIAYIQLSKQIAGRRAMSDFPTFDQGNDEAFETLTDLMIHFFNRSHYSSLFYGINLCKHLKKKSVHDARPIPSPMPKNELCHLASVAEHVINGLLTDEHYFAASDLYIAAIDYFEPDEMAHLDEMADLPIKIMEAASKKDTEKNLLPTLRLMIKCVVNDQRVPDNLNAHLLRFYHRILVGSPIPSTPLLISQFHQQFIDEESRLLVLVKQNPERWSAPLSRLLTFHYQMVLISVFKGVEPYPSIERVFYPFLEVGATLPHIGPFDIASLRRVYEANQNLTQQLESFETSKRAQPLIPALGSLDIIHGNCPKILLIQNIVYARTCEVASLIYTAIQQPEFDQDHDFLESIAPHFTHFLQEEQSIKWIDEERKNSSQLFGLINKINLYVEIREKAIPPHNASASRNAFNRMMFFPTKYLDFQSIPYIQSEIARKDFNTNLFIDILPADSPPIVCINQALTLIEKGSKGDHAHESSNIVPHILSIHNSKLSLDSAVDLLRKARKQLQKLDPKQETRKKRLADLMEQVDHHLEKVFIELNVIFKHIEELILQHNWPKFIETFRSDWPELLEAPPPFVMEPLKFYKDGVNFFKGALKENPHSDAALEGLGNCLLSALIPNGEEEALDYLTKGNQRSLCILGLRLRTLHKLGLYREFLLAFTNRQIPRSIESSSLHPFYPLLGEASLKVNQPDQAAHYYQEMYTNAHTLEDMINAQKALTALRVQRPVQRQHARQSAAVATE